MLRGQACRIGDSSARMLASKGAISRARPLGKSMLRKRVKHERGLGRLAAQVVDQRPKGPIQIIQESNRKTGGQEEKLPEPRHDAKPGILDDATFPQHWSVQFWRNWRIPAEIRDEKLSTGKRVQNVLRALQEGARRAGVFSSPQSLAYWSYHVPRMGFFAANGIAGAAYSQYISKSDEGLSGSSMGSSGNLLDIPRLLRYGFYVPLSEALLTFYQDFQNIRNGLYKMPWDMTTPTHRQTNPVFVLDKVTRWFSEAADTLSRRTRNEVEPLWLDSNLYPDYYKSTWHYQSDGWMSDKSASVYETSTETVFVGRQDAMQRQSLVPISEFIKQDKFSREGAGLQLLDVATGTGRAATFVKDNFPKMGITQLDLSPFYLQKARENMDYWRSKRGGSNPEDTVASKDRFLQAPAENIPVPDASYDIVMSTYLFHEIPEDSRRRVAREMERTCKPGGLVVLSDGIQYGDRPDNDATASNFQAFNEPNWGTHVRTDYGKLFGDLGLIPHKKVLASGTKVLSFKKMPQN